MTRSGELNMSFFQTQKQRLWILIAFVLTGAVVFTTQTSTVLAETNMDVKVKITSVKAKGCPDDWILGCGDADFRALMHINNNFGEAYPKNSDGYIDDDNYVTGISWVVPHDGTGPGYVNQKGPEWMLGETPVRIAVYDVDGFLRFEDDQMDVGPGPARDHHGRVEWDTGNFEWAQYVVVEGNPDGTDLVIPLEPVEDQNWYSGSFELTGNTSTDSDYRVTIGLQVDIKVPSGLDVDEKGDKVRPLGIHHPLHPQPDDVLTITGALVDEWGDPVEWDSLEIVIDPDGKNPHDDIFVLNGSGSGTCWSSGSQTGSICQESIDLSSIPEPNGLDDDEQRMIAYSVRAKNTVSDPPMPFYISNGWRMVTVGNRTNARQIGFSLATGNPRFAVDILYTPHGPDYGAGNCSVEPIDLWDEIWDYFSGSSEATVNCEFPVNETDFLTAVNDNWTNAWFTSKEWATNPNVVAGENEGFYHYDLFTYPESQRKLNFWYTTDPGYASGMVEHDLLGYNTCEVYTPRIVKTDPNTGDKVSESGYGWFDVAYLMHETPWRDCAPVTGKKVSIERTGYGTTVHETGHRPFGLADEYCGPRPYGTGSSGCDGGYFQRVNHPNLYGDDEDYKQWYPFQEAAIYYGVGDSVPGCEGDPLLGSDGVPFPEAFLACESFEGTILDIEWWRPEPRGSLMGNHRHAVSIPFVGDVRVQAGPQSFARIKWYLSRCEEGRC